MSVAKVGCDLVRTDRDGAPSLLISCERSFGGYLHADFGNFEGFDKGFDGFANIDPLRQRDARFSLKQFLRRSDFHVLHPLV